VPSRANTPFVTEADFIIALRGLPLHPGALGLADDAARLGALVLTSDTIVEGVHFLANDPAGDVAWKLVAVNMSDLAAKGARPEGVMLSFPLGDDDWDRAFLGGLHAALEAFDCPLLGGDTVSLPVGAPRVMTLTAIGKAGAHSPTRSGAQAGDALYVTGTIGDAGAGLAIAQALAGGAAQIGTGTDALLSAYRRPTPRLTEGIALAPLVHAMMDVSDGLLIDAARMAAASRLAVCIDLAAVPLSTAYTDHAGDGIAARITAATAGDDYQLLFAAAKGVDLPVPATRIGQFSTGNGIRLRDGDDTVPLPANLGFQHRA